MKYFQNYRMEAIPTQNIQLELFDKKSSSNVLASINYHMVMFTVNK